MVRPSYVCVALPRRSVLRPFTCGGQSCLQVLQLVPDHTTRRAEEDSSSTSIAVTRFFENSPRIFLPCQSALPLATPTELELKCGKAVLRRFGPLGLMCQKGAEEVPKDHTKVTNLEMSSPLQTKTLHILRRGKCRQKFSQLHVSLPRFWPVLGYCPV